MIQAVITPAAGGVRGAEGAVWLAVSGTPEQEASAKAVLADVGGEPPFGSIKI